MLSVASAAGVAASARRVARQHVTALNPLQYQKRLRLQEARRLVLDDGFDAAEAAFRVGYDSPSQFSREYRRLFGAQPRQDLASVKGRGSSTGVCRLSNRRRPVRLVT